MEFMKYIIYISKYVCGREIVVVVVDVCLFCFLMVFCLIDGWFWELMSDFVVNNDVNSVFIGFCK